MPLSYTIWIEDLDKLLSTCRGVNHVRSKPMFGCLREKDKRLVMDFAAEIPSLFFSTIRFIVSVIFFNVAPKSKKIFDCVDSIRSQKLQGKSGLNSEILTRYLCFVIWTAEKWQCNSIHWHNQDFESMNFLHISRMASSGSFSSLNSLLLSPTILLPSSLCRQPSPHTSLNSSW